LTQVCGKEWHWDGGAESSFQLYQRIPREHKDIHSWHQDEDQIIHNAKDQNNNNDHSNLVFGSHVLSEKGNLKDWRHSDNSYNIWESSPNGGEFFKEEQDTIGVMALINSRVGGIKGELGLVLVSWIGMKDVNVTNDGSSNNSHPNYTCPQFYDRALSHQWYNQWISSSIDADVFQKLHCLQMRTTDLSFLKFSRSQWESQKEYLGPREQAQDVKRMEFNMPQQSLWNNVTEWFLEASILHFGEEVVQCNDTNYAVACKSHLDKLKSVTYFSHEDQLVHIPYRNQSVCFEGRCAASIRLGEKCSNYFWEEEELNDEDPCHFTLHYLVVNTPSIIYPFDDFWKYSALAFVSALFMWLFVSFFCGSTLHWHYMSRYYVRPNHKRGVIPVVKPGDYSLCLDITAEAFSKFRGTFEIRQEGSFDCMLRRDLDLAFDEEDVENSGLTTMRQTFQFTAEESYKNLQLCIEWEGERTISDFKRPKSMAVVSRRVPPFMALSSNLCCSPLYACGLMCCFPRYRRRCVLFQEYLLFALFTLCAHCSWIIFLIFALLMNEESIEDYFWGDASNRPLLVVLIYCAFVVSVMTPAIILFNPRQQKSRKDFLFPISTEMSREHFAEDDENPFHDAGHYIRLKEQDSDEEEQPEDVGRETHDLRRKPSGVLSLLSNRDSFSILDDLMGWQQDVYFDHHAFVENE